MEKRLPRRGKTVCRVLTLGALLAAVGVVPAAFATLIPGGGKTASDCLVELDVAGVDPSQVTKGKKVECIDGDPCDADAACNGSCTFETAVCILQDDPALADCTPPSSLTSITVNAMGGVIIPSPAASAPGCGDTVDAVVALKGNKQKPGKLIVKATAKQANKPKKDADSFQLRCVKREGPCPTTTSTSSTSTTSTLPPVVCGDGVVGAGEQCDPPCGAGCGGGQLCNSQCQCVAQAACACGAPDPMQALFRTIDGAGTCGELLDGAGAALTVNADSSPGLNCSGLYFGGRDNAVPLPNSIPNNGMSVANVCCSGTSLTAIGATAAETGSERNCTAAGCLFGSPLPVINPTNPGTSTCVINRLGSSAVGSGDCSLGTTELVAPLSSEIFLAGDSLFNCLVGDTTPPGQACGSDADCGVGGLCPTGIQPCPVCRGTPGNEECFGGPNNGMACTPETTTVGEGYPTSHDCPPDPMNTIGSLPISFTLSTGTLERTAQQLGTPRVFCGFCRDADDTLCFEGNTKFRCSGGTNPGTACTTLGNEDPACLGGGRCVTGCPLPVGQTHPCDSNDDCAQPYESCEQNSPGAFRPGGGTATTIRLFGTPAGDVTDRQEHAATLASIFCIPPTFDPIIDSAANLPGPGAVSLPGFSQLQ
jgi:hypothetical protein